MFPFVYGFEWTPGTFIFLGAFFMVLAVLTTVVLRSTFRTLRLVRERTADAMLWKDQFQKLPAEARRCRHDTLGTAPGRLCPNAFQCGTCADHRAFRAQEGSRDFDLTDRHEPVLGLFFPRDRYYDRGHMWVQPLRDGTYRLGLDDLARRLYAEVPSVELPEVGSALARGGPACTITEGSSAVRVPSPLDGTVLERGDFWDGWLLHVRPKPGTDLEHLLRGDEVGCWVRDQLDTLQCLLADRPGEVLLADGGMPVDNFAAAAPSAPWGQVRRVLLLDPVTDEGSGIS